MSWVKKHPFSKQGIKNPNEFMSYSKDGLFKRQTLRETFLKIPFKDRIKSNYFMCHKPDNSSQMFIASFRELTFPFKLSRFIDSGVNAHKGNKLLSKFMDNFINFFKFLREENEGRDCLREDELFGFTLRGNRVFCQPDNLLSRDKRFSAFRGIKERDNFIPALPFNCMGRGIRLKQIQDRFRERIYMIRQFWEGDKKELFNVIFQFSNLTANIFSFSGQISELLRRRGAKAFIQRLMIVKKERSNGKGIFFISFGLSDGEFSVIRDEEGIKEQSFKFSSMEEGKQRDVVKARGFIAIRIEFLG